VLEGVGHENFRIGILDLLDHDLELIDFDLAGLLVEGDLDIHLVAILLGHGGPNGFFQGVDQHLAVDALVLADLVDGFFEFQIHERPPFSVRKKPPCSEI
jgi:hypothetical protein